MHLCLIDWWFHLSSIHMHYPRSSSGCSSMKDIYARIDWGSIFPLYIGIVLDLSVGLVLWKASMLEWLGRVHLPSIYMHCPRSSSGCSGMQDIYTRMTGVVHLPSIYRHCPRSISGFSIMQGIYAWLTGKATWSGMVFKASIILIDWVGHLPSIHRHCPRSSSRCSGRQGICA